MKDETWFRLRHHSIPKSSQESHDSQGTNYMTIMCYKIWNRSQTHAFWLIWLLGYGCCIMWIDVFAIQHTMGCEVTRDQECYYNFMIGWGKVGFIVVRKVYFYNTIMMMMTIRPKYVVTISWINYLRPVPRFSHFVVIFLYNRGKVANMFAICRPETF